MATTADVFRDAANVIDAQRHATVGPVTAIRIAAHGITRDGRKGHDLAEQALQAFAAHQGVEVADLEREFLNCHKDLTTRALRDAADAMGQVSVRGGEPIGDEAEALYREEKRT